MTSMNDAGVVAVPASGRTSCPRRLRRLAVTGVIATLAAMVATTLAAALAQAAGVDARPAERFGWTAGSLTAISLVPPLLSGATTATITALIGLHLVAAIVMIPTLSRSLRTPSWCRPSLR